MCLKVAVKSHLAMLGNAINNQLKEGAIFLVILRSGVVHSPGLCNSLYLLDVYITLGIVGAVF